MNDKSEMQKEMSKNKEFLRVNKPFSGARAILCIWCGEAVLYADSKTPPENLIEQMREHDLECKASPLVKQISELQTENMELRGERVAHLATKSVLNRAHEHIAELEAEKCRKE